MEEHEEEDWERENMEEGGDRSQRLSFDERNAKWFAGIGVIREIGFMFVLSDDDGGAGRSGLRLVGVSANVTTADWWRHERSAERGPPRERHRERVQRTVRGSRACSRAAPKG